MKDTIKAEFGYTVGHKAGCNRAVVRDGREVLFVAEIRSMEDYVDEVKNGNNECAVMFEVFTTVKGNQFIYWADLEADEDYITRVA